MAAQRAYLREEDLLEYRRFCKHHIPVFGRDLPSELWHYANADGLIGILKTGAVWSTQVSCLNDTLEHRFFGDIVHAALKVRRGQNTDTALGTLYRLADDALSNRDYTSEGYFVTCFSDIEDDLGQWRGYGGGECGYAIGFNSLGILEALKARPSAMLLPMCYDEKIHTHVVNDVVRMALQYFQEGLQRGFADIDKWAAEFLAGYAKELEFFSTIIKHPKFVSESERRITTSLQASEVKSLEFRQKRTLLARHLPIDLSVKVGEATRLPITRICIGPGASQKISRISVGDLLLRFDYLNIPVELSKVPYRIP